MPKAVVHVNVAKIMLVAGGFALLWKYLDVLADSDDAQKKKFNDSISGLISFAKWRLW